MDNKVLRIMKIDFSESASPKDYILGRITAIIDVSIGDERVLISSDTRYPDKYEIKFWADDLQFEKIKKNLIRLVPIKSIKIAYCKIKKSNKEES